MLDDELTPPMTAGQAEGEEDLPSNGGTDGGRVVPKWVPKAWEMRIVGMQSWESIGAAVGHKWDTVKRWVIAYSRALGEVADEEDTIHARAEYISSLQRIKQRTESVVLREERAANPDTATDHIRYNPLSEIGALNTQLKACEKLAAAKGVVTERKAQELSGSLDLTMLGKLRSETRRAAISDLEGEGGEEDTPAADEEGS